MRAICTTTINKPTEALLKFIDIAEKQDWLVIIAGDHKTPDDDFVELASKYESVIYLSDIDQQTKWPKLSNMIGFNCIQRRNFAMLHAWELGAEYIAVVDDDNIPSPRWGKNVTVGQELDVMTQRTDCELFDPLSATHPQLWHRGFPTQLLDKRNLKHPIRIKRKVLVQADFWDGDPDIDAICRIALSPEIKFNPAQPIFAGDKPSPFNSQNTFIHRELMREYFLFPYIGRMDDIWAAYFVQAIHPDCVVFGPASVYQQRNEHDLIVDLKNELIGYEHTLDFTRWLENSYKKRPEGAAPEWPEYIPSKTIEAFKEWVHLTSKLG
jgi:hypothetical protein